MTLSYIIQGASPMMRHHWGSFQYDNVIVIVLQKQNLIPCRPRRASYDARALVIHELLHGLGFMIVRLDAKLTLPPLSPPFGLLCT